MSHKAFSYFPMLITERLTLRQPSERDRAQLFLLRSDPAVNEYLDRKPPGTMEEILLFIQKVNEHFTNKTGIYWTITITGSDQLVGTICLFDFSWETAECEIGYELLPAYQGQGMMNEALKKVIEFSFHTLGIKNMNAVAHKNNMPSARLLRKCGFRETGLIDDAGPEMVLYRLQAITSAPAEKQDRLPSAG